MIKHLYNRSFAFHCGGGMRHESKEGLQKRLWRFKDSSSGEGESSFQPEVWDNVLKKSRNMTVT